jgi:hypothetical protein
LLGVRLQDRFEPFVLEEESPANASNFPEQSFAHVAKMRPALRPVNHPRGVVILAHGIKNMGAS